MPKLIYNASEIIDSGKSTVDAWGKLYVGRKHKDKQIEWVVMKNKK